MSLAGASVAGAFDEREVERALAAGDLEGAQQLASHASVGQLVTYLRRRTSLQQAVLFRLLPKDTAREVFDALGGGTRAALLGHLRESEVSAIIDAMAPDDRAVLFDELPAGVASRLLSGLNADERALTATVLGYPEGSVGRRMSPELVPLRRDLTAAEALARVHERADDVETIYTLAVVDDERRLVGVVGLRTLMLAAPQTLVGELSRRADVAVASEPAEAAARRCAHARHLALPVVDFERRLVGIFTVDDALAILQQEESEDIARQAGSEALRTPYLATPIRELVRARVVWLLVLAIGAVLTVQVLERFEATLSQMVVLSVFIPLLIGTGGNTGNQAATTVTRALALGEVRPADVGRIVARELVVGLCLGSVLGSLGFALVGLVYGWTIGAVIGLTLVLVCTLAASAGSAIPLVAKLLHADPAVFSNPFISTLLDASGLVIYFLVAKQILNL